MKSYFFPDLDARLWYLDIGQDGPPLVVIHGLGCASSFEYPAVVTAPPLAGRRILLIDLFGFGYSDRPIGFSYSISDQADRLVSLVKASGFEKIDLMGHSMGGAIAVELAAKLDEQVNALVLTEPSLDGGASVLTGAITAQSEGDYIATGHAAMIRAEIEDGNHPWAATMRAAAPYAVYRAAQSLITGSTPSWRETLSGLSCRKTVIYGAHSLPAENFSRLKADGIPTDIVPDAGHSMGVENPNGVAEAIARALTA